MPHKHKRRDQDDSTFDLPPTQFAKPLPVNRKSEQTQQHAKAKNGKNGKNGKPAPAPKDDVQSTQGNLKRKRDNTKADDAPRAFKRLMALSQGKKIRSGLDNGDGDIAKNSKKKKKGTAQDSTDSPAAEQDTSATKVEMPTIRPGERMSEFSARVDAAIPVSGLINKSVRNGKDPLGLKVWRTKKEKKMHKMYDEWREEERKIKEQKEEDAELQAEKDMEDEEKGISWKQHMGQSGAGEGGKKGKKGKKARMLGEAADDNEDPWEALKKKRGEARAGLHDVNQAPPEINVKPKKKMTAVLGAAVDVEGIPKAAGSLRRREELRGVREDVVASYRKLMDSKRASLKQK